MSSLNQAFNEYMLVALLQRAEQKKEALLKSPLIKEVWDEGYGDGFMIHFDQFFNIFFPTLEQVKRALPPRLLEKAWMRGTDDGIYRLEVHNYQDFLNICYILDPLFVVNVPEPTYLRRNK